MSSGIEPDSPRTIQAASLMLRLQRDFTPYLGGRSVQPAVGPSRGPAPPSLHLRRRLFEDFTEAYQKNWSIPCLTAPHTEETLEFLKMRTLAHLQMPSSQSSNPLLAFCLDVLQGALTQIATQYIHASIEKPPTSVHPITSSASSDAEIASIEAKLETIVLDEAAFEEEWNALLDDTSEGSSGRDPSSAVMQNVTRSALFGRARSSVVRLLKEELTELGEATALNRAYEALGSGRSLTEATAIAAEARAANQAFIRNTGRVVSVAALSGRFLSKVEEIGWQGATGEMARDAVISFVSKHSATMLTRLVGCTNPVWCAGVVSTIISNTFIPTETAPPGHDMRPPLPTPPLEAVTGSKLPSLIPPYPALRPN